jgi:hypothetical protein
MHLGDTMEKSFNLKNFYKKAFYEGVQGYAVTNSRCFPNCLKSKMDGKNKSQQEAYMDCIKEYNDMGKDEWSLKYAECKADSKNENVGLELPEKAKVLKNSK